MAMNARRALFIALLLLIACGSQSPQNVLNGYWRHRPSPDLMASGEDLHLYQEGETLTGTGRYFLEAGPSGQLQVNGTVHGAQFTLTLEFDSGLTATYVGKVAGLTATYVGKVEAPSTLLGTLTYGSSAPMEGAVFSKLNVVCSAICVAGACTLPHGRCISSPRDQCSNPCFCEAQGGHWSASGCP